MEPTLRVTERGVDRWVVGEVTQPTAALVRIDPDRVVKDALDQQSATIQSYLRTVGSSAQRTVDAAPRAPTGYSNDSELRARNTRYFVTITAYVTVTAVLAFGLVQLAILADITPGEWFWPMWLTLAGALALGLIRLTHQSESERTPEGIELERVRSEGYSVERDADGRNAIAQAVAEAISWRAQSEYADSQARQLATQQAFERILPQRQLTVDNGMATYATSIDVQPATAPQRSERWTFAPVQPDVECLRLCEAVSRLYADAGQRGDNLITTRLPWAQRGDWTSQQKRLAVDVLSQLDPPLLLDAPGRQFRLNTSAWPMPLALSAIRRRWPRT